MASPEMIRDLRLVGMHIGHIDMLWTLIMNREMTRARQLVEIHGGHINMLWKLIMNREITHARQLAGIQNGQIFTRGMLTKNEQSTENINGSIGISWRMFWPVGIVQEIPLFVGELTGEL